MLDDNKRVLKTKRNFWLWLREASQVNTQSKLVNTIDQVLLLLHMDLFGLISVLTNGKKSIIDDFSRFTLIKNSKNAQLAMKLIIMWIM